MVNKDKDIRGLLKDPTTLVSHSTSQAGRLVDTAERSQVVYLVLKRGSLKREMFLCFQGKPCGLAKTVTRPGR